MKITELPKSGQCCYKCDRDMFAIETPHGANYTTCPICGDGSDTRIYENSRKYVHYCSRCNIIFNIGCIHSLNDVIDNVYYGCLVKDFIDENGMEVKGMPVFDSLEEAEKLFPKIKLNLVCMCDGTCKENHCKCAFNDNPPCFRCCDNHM